jgi:hypothetical protein
MSRDRKTYLHPRMLRRAAPVLIFVQKRLGGYELCVYYTLVEKKGKKVLDTYLKGNTPYRGIGTEYGSCSCHAISKELYLEFIRETRRHPWNKALRGKKK